MVEAVQVPPRGPGSPAAFGGGDGAGPFSKDATLEDGADNVGLALIDDQLAFSAEIVAKAAPAAGAPALSRAIRPRRVLFRSSVKNSAFIVPFRPTWSSVIHPSDNVSSGVQPLRVQDLNQLSAPGVQARRRTRHGSSLGERWAGGYFAYQAAENHPAALRSLSAAPAANSTCRAP